MLERRCKHLFEKPLTSLAKNIYISPNALTVTGFLFTILAAITLAHNLFWGGILILVGGFFDLLDGMVARIHNKLTDFGAFLDSVLDRYSDAFLFLGFTWYFFNNKSFTGVCLSLGALVGALLISYTRARAEGLGRECKAGIMERPERILLLALAAITGWAQPVMGIMIVMVHFTVFQRIYHVWKVMKKDTG